MTNKEASKILDIYNMWRLDKIDDPLDSFFLAEELDEAMKVAVRVLNDDKLTQTDMFCASHEIDAREIKEKI